MGGSSTGSARRDGIVRLLPADPAQGNQAQRECSHGDDTQRPGRGKNGGCFECDASYLSVVAKLVLTVCIVFCEDHSSESGKIVNGPKDPLKAGDAANWFRHQERHGHDIGNTLASIGSEQYSAQSVPICEICGLKLSS